MDRVTWYLYCKGIAFTKKQWLGSKYLQLKLYIIVENYVSILINYMISCYTDLKSWICRLNSWSCILKWIWYIFFQRCWFSKKDRSGDCTWNQGVWISVCFCSLCCCKSKEFSIYFFVLRLYFCYFWKKWFILMLSRYRFGLTKNDFE